MTVPEIQVVRSWYRPLRPVFFRQKKAEPAGREPRLAFQDLLCRLVRKNIPGQAVRAIQQAGAEVKVVAAIKIVIVGRKLGDRLR